MDSPIEIQKKYQSSGVTGYLLGATEFARQNLANLSFSPLDIVRKDDTGDIVSQMDRCVHESVIRYFQEIGISVAILGEEGQEFSERPRYAILIDEIEGTQNAVNGLDYGINMAIAPYGFRLKVRDLESAVVTNLRDDTVFVGEKGSGAYKIVNGKRQEFVRKQTDVYECPNPRAYTTNPEQVERQELLTKVFTTQLGNQPRSLDSTGTRLVELADSNIRAYGDWRNATKCWDVLPSALIVQEAGYTFTDVLGFDLSETFFYDRENIKFSKDSGLNRRVGENFIAARPSDHGVLLFSVGGKKARHYHRLMEPVSIWNGIFLRSDEKEVPTDLALGPYGMLIWGENFDNAGLNISTLLKGIIEERKEAYGNLSQEAINWVVNKIEETYIKGIPKKEHIRDQSELFWASMKNQPVERTHHCRDFLEESRKLLESI